MRFIAALSLFFATLLSGCALKGVVVEKRFRPVACTDTLGTAGIYNFQLRDAQGIIHSQMVTPGVFALYEVGDYFDDLGAPPVHDGKDYRAPVRLNPPQFQQMPYDAVPDLDVPIRPRPLRTRKPAPLRSEATTSSASREVAPHKPHHSSKTAQKKHRRSTRTAANSAKRKHSTAARKHKKKSAKVAKARKHSTAKKIASNR